MASIKGAVEWATKTALDERFGYDQKHRNGPDYDCSSFISTALYLNGFNISPYSWTGNMRKQLLACGFVDCKAPWRLGDIHLVPGRHVVMSINSTQIVHASINELGKTTGGKTGDQLGNEICIRPYYNYNSGGYKSWAYHMRFMESADSDFIVRQIIAGQWGNGAERIAKLREAGYTDNQINDFQQEVNRLLKNELSTVNLDRVAREVLKGKYGNGEERKSRLKADGFDPLLVQAKVNDMLGRIKNG